MLASGQMSFDIQKDFNRRKSPLSREDNLNKSILYPDKSPPEMIAEEISNTKIASSDTGISQQEEPFKFVQNKLKLNQSAMSPDKQNIATQKLDDLADKSDSVLLKVSTFWPFTFFVNDIIIDPYKVNIIFREFFWSEHIHSVLIKDILDVVVETSIFFATITIVDQGYIENSICIPYLKRNDALKARKIIQGLIIAHRQAVDLSVLQNSQIKDQAEELGKVKGIDPETANYNYNHS